MSKEALILYSSYVVYIKKLWENNLSNVEINELNINKLNLSALEKEMNGNSDYFNLNSEILKEKTGFPYYTYHTFLLERMHKIILVSNGFQCSDIIEYNPDVNILSAILIINDKEFNIIDKIKELFGTYSQFTITNKFFSEITESDAFLTINFTIGNITSKIQAFYGETLASVYWKRRINI